jgi:hypothetical protein
MESVCCSCVVRACHAVRPPSERSVAATLFVAAHSSDCTAPLVFGHLKLRVPLQLSAGQCALLLGRTSSVMLLLHCASLRIRVTPKLSLL